MRGPIAVVLCVLQQPIVDNANVGPNWLKVSPDPIVCGGKVQRRC